MPNDTRIAPALLPPRCWMICRKRGSVMSAPAAAPASMSASVSPSATSPAPGLQKQPVRSEIRSSLGELLDAPVVEEMAVRIVEVERDRAAAHRGRHRPVDAYHVPPVGVLQTRTAPGAATPSAPAPASESSRCRRAGDAAARFRRPGCSDSSGCRPRSRLRAARGCASAPGRVAKLTVPPANHGRRSFASAAWRAIRHPTPVG